ncbi:NADH:ubiquinone oxidoreductase, 17.2kDa subunit [Wolffia australiana]
MSKFFSKFAEFFRSRTLAGKDKFGNRYFSRTEEVDGILKEKRWVIFKGEDDPTAIPVEWICWLNGQRKKAPSPEELLDLEARREHLRLNIEWRKKLEEEEKKAKSTVIQHSSTTAKVKSPDLKSFIQQFPGVSFDKNEAINSADVSGDKQRSTEPTGTGASFKPGTWQPPS